MHALGLDSEPECNQIYVFYQLPDGRVDNFSIGIRRGRSLTPEEMIALMKREYPATRQAQVLAVERPGGIERMATEWIDTADLCAWLKVSRRTVERWRRRGLIKGRRMGGRLYFARHEVDRALLEGGIKASDN